MLYNSFETVSKKGKCRRSEGLSQKSPLWIRTKCSMMKHRVFTFELQVTMSCNTILNICMLYCFFLVLNFRTNFTVMLWVYDWHVVHCCLKMFCNLDEINFVGMDWSVSALYLQQGALATNTKGLTLLPWTWVQKYQHWWQLLARTFW